MLPFALPEVAVIVAVRLARLAPAAKVTVATPEALVVTVGWVRVPLLVSKTIPTPGSPTLPESLTTAEIVHRVSTAANLDRTRDHIDRLRDRA